MIVTSGNKKSLFIRLFSFLGDIVSYIQAKAEEAEASGGAFP